MSHFSSFLLEGHRIDLDDGIYTRQGMYRWEWLTGALDADLEHIHNYIQWYFPLPEPSRFNPDAPLLDAVDICVIKFSTLARIRVKYAVWRMALFYSRDKEWWRPFNHNHLRITRILRFLALVGYDDLAKEFYETIRMLLPEDNEIRPATWRHWQEALQGRVAA